MNDVISVHQLGAPERCLLAELFAEEGNGEEALHLGRQTQALPSHAHRYDAARRLCELGLCRLLSVDLVAFTPVGRRVAEAIVERLLYGRFARAS